MYYVSFRSSQNRQMAQTVNDQRTAVCQGPNHTVCNAAGYLTRDDSGYRAIHAVGNFCDGPEPPRARLRARTVCLAG